MSPRVIPASSSACWITGFIRSTWSREAISGTTPPKRACRSTCEAITFERRHSPSSTIAAAVSSQELSIPSTRTDELLQGGEPLREPLPIVDAPEIVDPHNHGVLAVVAVVAPPARDGREAVLFVEAAGT